MTPLCVGASEIEDAQKKRDWTARRESRHFCFLGEGAGMWRTYGAPIAFALGFPALTGWAKFVTRLRR
jgi:hypothetical protein